MWIWFGTSLVGWLDKRMMYKRGKVKVKERERETFSAIYEHQSENSTVQCHGEKEVAVSDIVVYC
jgi:hypothetical protein